MAPVSGRHRDPRDPQVRLKDPGHTQARPRDPRQALLGKSGAWPWCTTGVRMAHPFIAAYAVTTALFLLLPGAISQQQSPLRGQGIDPVTANASQTAVPVYLSIVLQRVTSINEKLYKYEVLLDVYMSWVDPRVTIGKELVLEGVYDAANSWTFVSTACANVTAPRALQACQKAANEWYKSQINLPTCQKPCTPTDPLVCCDAVWLPNLDLPTNLAYSQDRYVKEEINNLDSFPNGMLRVVRVQGEFSNIFDFGRFPFDSQVLALPLVSLGSPDHYYLQPSFVGRVTPAYLTPKDSPSALENSSTTMEGGGSESGSGSGGGDGGGDGGGGGGGGSSQEITGWTISGVSLKCIPDRDVLNQIEKSLLKWQQPNRDDPYFQSFALSNNSAPSAPPGPSPQDRTTVCTLSINVDRISSYYIWMDVVPVVLTTAIAFSVLVTAPTAIDVRLSVVVTLFLALVAIQFIIVDQLPKTEYLTAFGAMVITSYAVFFALIVEAVVVYYVSSVRVFHLYRTSAKKRREEEGEEEMEVFAMNGRDPASLERLSNTLTRMVSNRGSQRSLGSVREHPNQGESQTDYSETQRQYSESEEEGIDGQDPRGTSTAKRANRQYSESEEEGIDGQDPDAPRIAPRMKGKKRSGSWRSWGPFGAWYQRLASDHFEGYRIACWIDWVCGPLFILGYITAMIIFSVS